MNKLVVSLHILFLVSFVLAQNAGTNKREYHLEIPIQVCVSQGNCMNDQGSITLDSNWRWTHLSQGYQNCYDGNKWDTSVCSDEDTCAKNCAIDGVEQNDWANPYGVTQVPGGVKFQLVTRGQYGNNIGTRTYVMDGDKYKIFKLLNKEFSFDVDVSNLPCGVNGALYFVEMLENAGQSQHSQDKAGAKYGTGYCDAQCPHDLKWIYGKANVKDWTPNPKDKNSGAGHYGSCCAELDIWEANKFATQMTVHPCNVGAHHRCEGVDCGDNEKGQRHQGVCDKDGCDFNPYRMGDHTFFGPGSQFQVDTSRPFQVVTQFLTHDGTDTGDLVEMKRFYVQDGRKIMNSKTNIQGLENYNSISEGNCNAQKGVFEENNHFSRMGGLKQMGKAMERGMVLVLSLWDDHDVNMLWLDSDWPLDIPREKTGVQRGPCSRDSGNPDEIEKLYGDSSVKYMNIKVGPLNSTFKLESMFLQE